ncbi:hypothetical protein [Flagellimonas ochracea]|uniref:hypothetical protein n=1 Tax=Flagellimonas ochracea TaxID=2696472 RepID=UPI001AA18E8A|nr:hypothetical protein [Allomuricauda ochracea]
MKKIIQRLLKGDVAIQYQEQRDLLAKERKDLQGRIAFEGWGNSFLSKRNVEGHCGRGFYQPKWISSHYTLLDLRNLCISPENKVIRESIAKILRQCKVKDGGIYPISKKSDVYVNDRFLYYASYFQAEQEDLKSVIDLVLSEQMPDGGFNCRSNRSGAVHSSLHTTLSILEGFTEYKYNKYTYRIEDVKEAIGSSKEFILMHQLYLSDRTGKLIDKNFLRLSYPGRWRYDILPAMDYFRYSLSNWDERMQPALDVLLKKRNRNGTWNLQAKLPGQTHFDMEKVGKPSRWNTLRALRDLKYFGIDGLKYHIEAGVTHFVWLPFFVSAPTF